MSFTYKYPRPSLAVDMVVFTIHNMVLKVLLIERGGEPFKGKWAIPGGFVDVSDEGNQGESLDEAAARELKEETNLSANSVFLEQLYTFGEPGRDPRGRVISATYYALVSPDLSNRIQAGDDAASANWFPVVTAQNMDLAFDHRDILDVAVTRIQGKIDYEPLIAANLVPVEFTRKEFRRVHEIVKGTKYDKTNFKRRFNRMVEDGKIKQVVGKRETAGRPADLYTIETKTK